jgi:nucleoside-diphosphate-sugar epimerase
VCQFVGYKPEHVQRDYRLFAGKTKQYIFISSTAAYQKPVVNYRMTEETAFCNPYWDYAREKAACEEFLMQKYREEGFPVTIVRPSHTYGERSVPLAVRGKKGSWQILKRMMEGKKVIIHGDGTNLWTLTHNSDFAKGFVGLIGNPVALGEAFHITSDESVTWNQVYQIVADRLNVPLHAYHVSTDFLSAVNPPHDYWGSLMGDKANSVVFDNTKLKKAVPGFRATVSVAEGIANTVDYVLAHPQCQADDPEFDDWCDRVINALENAKKSLQ